MPSDDLVAATLDALAPPRDRFRSALASTLDRVRTLFEEARQASGGRIARLEAELGALGPRYLAVDRLAAVLDAGPTVDPTVTAVFERAFACLEDLAVRPAGGVVHALPAGAHLPDFVAAALADAGRAMGAARTVDLARSGRYRAADHDGWLDQYPFALWSQAERHLAPPLVIRLAGADLRPAGLAEYLDGGVKLVLLVDAPATPAPLARLITPGVFVAQAADAAPAVRLGRWHGPGVVAILPEGAATFVHDPSGGPGLAGRLTVTSQPGSDSLRRVGPFTVAQQRDELQHLAALAASRVPAATGPEAAAPAEDPVGKLAAWLLRQADTREAPPA